MTRNTLFRFSLVAALVAVATTSMWAQTKPAKDTAKAAADDEERPARKKFRGRLPNNYGQVGISEKQRQEIYDIQEKYYLELQDLVEKIKQIKSSRDEQIYNVLTDEQKAALAKLKSKPKAKAAETAEESTE